MKSKRKSISSIKNNKLNRSSIKNKKYTKKYTYKNKGGAMLGVGLAKVGLGVGKIAGKIALGVGKTVAKQGLSVSKSVGKTVAKEGLSVAKSVGKQGLSTAKSVGKTVAKQSKQFARRHGDNFLSQNSNAPNPRVTQAPRQESSSSQNSNAPNPRGTQAPKQESSSSQNSNDTDSSVTPDQYEMTKRMKSRFSSMRTPQMINPMSFTKIMPSLDDERDIKYYFKKGMYSLYKVLRTIISLPIRNLDEAIPPELCKKMTGNAFVCSRTMGEYILTGTKKDYKKMLLEKDQQKCLTLDENGNKIIKCKIEGGFQNSQSHEQKGGMIIGCDKTIIPKFKPKERVIVILNNEESENMNAEYIELNGVKWFIGTVTIVGDREYTIQIDNGSLITRPHTTNNEEIEKYNNQWKEFYKNLYNLPKIVLQDLYDIGYTLTHPFIKKFNQIMEIMYKKSGLYLIVKLFVFLSKNAWQSFDGLIKMDKDNIYVRSINALVSKYTSANLDFVNDPRLRVKIIFISMTMIYNRYLDKKNIQQTLDLLDDHSERIQYALGSKLKIIQEKIVKFNLYLRKYECPMSKVKSLIENINDSALLEKLLNSCNLLLKKETEYIEDDTKEKRKYKTEICDEQLYEYDLSIVPDSTHLDFNIDPDKETGSCESCSGNKWAEIIVRYGCFFSYALNGNTNNMTYILINIVEDVATMDSINTDEPDPVVENIKKILQNIECRSNLRKVIRERIELLNSIPIKG